MEQWLWLACIVLAAIVLFFVVYVLLNFEGISFNFRVLSAKDLSSDYINSVDVCRTLNQFMPLEYIGNKLIFEFKIYNNNSRSGIINTFGVCYWQLVSITLEPPYVRI